MELTPVEWEARLDYFREEREIGERHFEFAQTQIEKCTLFVMGQMSLEFPE